jgi:hypothetical protein
MIAFFNRMTARPLLRFLYPGTHRDLSLATKDAYVLFYSAGRGLTGLSRSPSRRPLGWSTCTYSTKAGTPIEESTGTSIGKKSDDIQQRLKELQNANALKYPRIQPDRNAISCAEFKKRYAVLNPEESRESDNVTLRGMLNRVAPVSIMTDCIREAILLANCGQEACIPRCRPRWKSRSRAG